MDIIDFLVKPYESYSYTLIVLEAIASIFGLLSVYYSAKKNILVYPTGIISTGIYIFLLYYFGLLGDMLINFYYTIMSIYGWVQWKKTTTQEEEITITYTDKKIWSYCLILFVLSCILVTTVYYYKPFIDNNFNIEGITLGLHNLDWANYVDILVTSIFLIGMYLMAKRKVESWIFWILGDIFCVPMMFYKGLGLTAIQYFIFTIISIQGYIEWKKSAVKSISK